jgi:hypothetical protein
MSVFRAKLWTGLGAAVVLGAGGLAACSGEGGEGGEAGAPASSAPAAGGEGEGGEAGAAPAAPAAAGGEGEGGEAGAAAAGGERGAAAAYAAVPADSRRALRLAQLNGFFLAAKAVGAAEGPEAAAALAGQGLLEVYDPAKSELAGVDEAVLRRAAASGAPADVNAAVSALQAAQKQAGGDPNAVARGLSALALGLYREASAGGAIDPVEYQHSYGAALALQAFAQQQGTLAGAKADIDRFVRLWPGPAAPAGAAPALPQVQAQASRVELALSGV